MNVYDLIENLYIHAYVGSMLVANAPLFKTWNENH